MKDNITDIAKSVLRDEAAALLKISDNIDDQFSKAVNAILNCKGRVVLTGIGKSGLIGKKIAASLASTGTPSFFLHSTEAYHGDLGMISGDDIIICVTNSGETDEVIRLIPFLKENGNKVIGLTGNSNSTLAKNCDFHISVHISREVCPLDLAPSTSVTASLVMGDALMVTLMKLRGFKAGDYAKLHPGGSLGKRLLYKVKDYMRTENLPFVDENSDITDTIFEINRSKLGLCLVGNKNNVLGIITDGDLRRAMKKHKRDFFDLTPKDIYTKNPIFIDKEVKLITAQELLNKNKISSLLVGNKTNVEGVIELYDIKL